MADPTRLPLTTSDGRPLVHKYYPQEDTPVGLLLIFPGAHYGPEGPLLYYPRQLLKHAGWDTLDLSYGFQTHMLEVTADTFEGLMVECKAAVNVALAQRGYTRVGLLGKSLGAGVVAHLCRGERGLASARAAYLTPPIGTPFFDAALRDTDQPAYMAIGSGDRFFNQEALEALASERMLDLSVVEGADHHLAFPGDLEASMQATRRVVREVVDFLEREKR
jgi:dienelactone hydrolase